MAGAASVYPALQLLASSYAGTDGNGQVMFWPGNQTLGGITAVREGLVEVGAVTRAPKPEETDDSVQYRELAKDPLVVAVHPSVAGVTDLTSGQLRAVYCGTVRNWRELGGPDATIVVLDRPEDESAKVLLRQHHLGKDLKVTDAAVLLDTESELGTTLRDTPYAIGALSLAYATIGDLGVHPLSLDGVAPSADNVAAGQYRMVRSVGLVWRTAPNGKTPQFIDYALSEAGASTLRKAQYIPSSSNGK